MRQSQPRSKTRRFIAVTTMLFLLVGIAFSTPYIMAYFLVAIPGDLSSKDFCQQRLISLGRWAVPAVVYVARTQPLMTVEKAEMDIVLRRIGHPAKIYLCAQIPAVEGNPQKIRLIDSLQRNFQDYSFLPIWLCDLQGRFGRGLMLRSCLEHSGLSPVPPLTCGDGISEEFVDWYNEKATKRGGAIFRPVLFRTVGESCFVIDSSLKYRN